MTAAERMDAFNFHHDEMRRLHRFMDRLARIRDRDRDFIVSNLPILPGWRRHYRRYRMLKTASLDTLDLSDVHLNAMKRAWRGR